MIRRRAIPTAGRTDKSSDCDRSVRLGNSITVRLHLQSRLRRSRADADVPAEETAAGDIKIRARLRSRAVSDKRIADRRSRHIFARRNAAEFGGVLGLNRIWRGQNRLTRIENIERIRIARRTNADFDEAV